MPIVAISVIIFFILLFLLIKNIKVKESFKKPLRYIWIIGSLLIIFFLFRIGAPFIGIVTTFLFCMITFVNNLMGLVFSFLSIKHNLSSNNQKKASSSNVSEDNMQEIMTYDEALDILNLTSYGLNNITKELVDSASNRIIDSLSQSNGASKYILTRLLIAKNILYNKIDNRG